MNFIDQGIQFATRIERQDRANVEAEILRFARTYEAIAGWEGDITKWDLRMMDQDGVYLRTLDY